MSYEEKATLFISVARELKSDLALNVLKQVLDNVNQRMMENHADREDLIRFLKEFNNSGNAIICNLTDAFLNNAKNYFKSEIDSLENMVFFWDFADLFPEI